MVGSVAEHQNMTSTQRFLLRLAIVSLLAGLSALGVTINDGAVTAADWVAIATATITAGAAYAGVGAAIPQVEPNIGRKLELPTANISSADPTVTAKAKKL